VPETKFFIMMIVIYFIFIAGVGLVTHVFHALGLVTIARRRGIQRPNLAWLPVIGVSYIMGYIADDYDIVTQGNDRHLRSWLLGLSTFLVALEPVLIVMMFTSRVFEQDSPPLGFMVVLLLMLVAGIPFTVLHYVALFKLFRSCQPSNSVAFLALAIFLSITPFLIFIVRHRDEGMTTD